MTLRILVVAFALVLSRMDAGFAQAPGANQPPPAVTVAKPIVKDVVEQDDYTGRFAIWSGTSFAAPLFAGRVAAALVGKLPARGKSESASNAVARSWKAVSSLTDIKP